MYAARRIALAIAVSLSALLLTPSAAFAGTASDESEFVRHINELRASKGVPALVVHPQLTSVARAFAAQMAANGSIFHNPALSTQAPAEWQKLGENVGVGYDVAGLHQAFVNSPGHYRNLVDPAYRYVGLGVVHANGRTWVVEDFMQSAVPPSQELPKAKHTEKADRASNYQLAMRGWRK